MMSRRSNYSVGLAGMCDAEGRPVNDAEAMTLRIEDMVCRSSAGKMEALSAFNDCVVEATDGNIECSRSVLGTVSNVLRCVDLSLPCWPLRLA